MQRILVSACLLGEPLRYDGSGLRLADARLQRWWAEGRLLPFCPEVAGGLPVPRPPAEILGGGGEQVLDGLATVRSVAGDDVTDAFLRGARQALALCRAHDIEIAILTESSPSCGSRRIYDGSFSGGKIPGVGVTTALLRQHGIEVFSQHRLGAVARRLGETGP